MMGVTTMPRAFDILSKNGQYGYYPSILLDGAPTVVTSPALKITYKISPKAKWSDGQPITSTDFWYTWDQIVHGKDIYDTSGYADIASVDHSTPDTAVVTFSKPYADWKSLFGGGYGIYPSHLLQGKDRDAITKDGYTFSGGPWMIQAWQKGSQVTLVPNTNYWGDKPKLDKVVFKFVADTSAEFQAFKAGEVLVTYPQPQIDAVDQINAGIPNISKDITPDTGNSEALWINNQAPPFNDKVFRQAVAYAIDRDAIVKRLFGGVGVDKALQTLEAPILSAFADTSAFSQYKLDLSKVDSLMKGAGWAKGADGIWAKGGQRATFSIQSTAGNKRRELTEQVVQQQLKTAGFDMTINNQKAGDLFGSILPKGAYQMSLFANVVTSYAPAMCNIFCSKNVPTAANGFTGNNWYRVNIPSLDPLLETMDNNTDDSARQAAGKQADKIMADNMVTLPLDPLPNMVLWNNKVVGPIADNAIMGPFWNMNLWGVKA